MAAGAGTAAAHMATVLCAQCQQVICMHACTRAPGSCNGRERVERARVCHGAAARHEMKEERRR